MYVTDRSLIKLAEEEYDGLPSDVSIVSCCVLVQPPLTCADASVEGLAY